MSSSVPLSADAIDPHCLDSVEALRRVYAEPAKAVPAKLIDAALAHDAKTNLY
jgi:hypothetical protein